MEKDKIKVKSIILLLKNLYDCLKFKDDKRKKSNWFNRNTYTHRRSRDLVRQKEEIKCNNTIKQYKNV